MISGTRAEFLGDRARSPPRKKDRERERRALDSRGRGVARLERVGG